MGIGAAEFAWVVDKLSSKIFMLFIRKSHFETTVKTNTSHEFPKTLESQLLLQQNTDSSKPLVSLFLRLLPAIQMMSSR